MQVRTGYKAGWILESGWKVWRREKLIFNTFNWSSVPRYSSTQRSLCAGSSQLPGCWEVLSPTRKETSYSDQTLTFAIHSKKIRRLSVQPGLRGSDDLRVGRKMETFQLFFQSGRAKDLSAPCAGYKINVETQQGYRIVADRPVQSK